MNAIPSLRPIAAAFLLLGLALSPVCADQECPSVFRIWDQGQDHYFDYGEEVLVPSDHPVDLYVQVKSRSPTPYLARVVISYPEDLDLPGSRRGVDPYLSIKPQNDDDIRLGRLHLFPRQPGVVRLGYRIEGVSRPGSLDRVPTACRTDTVALRIGAIEPTPAAESSPSVALCQAEVEAKLGATPVPPMVVWEQPDYRGARDELTHDVPQLGKTEVGAHRASSVEVPEGCVVTLFEHPGYQGRSLRLTQSAPRLDAYRFDDVASSLTLRCPAPALRVLLDADPTVQILGRGRREVVRGTGQTRGAGAPRKFSYNCTVDVEYQQVLQTTVE